MSKLLLSLILALSVVCTAKAVVNNNFHEVAIVDESLVINDSYSGGMSRDGNKLSFNFGNVSGTLGDIISIPVTAQNFMDISRFQTGLKWDPTILVFSRISGPGASSVGIYDQNKDLGSINLIWSSGQGDISVGDDSTLFEMLFYVIGGYGESTILGFVDRPDFPFEVANSNGLLANFTSNDGTFTVSEPDRINGVALWAQDISTEGASSFCVPVSTRNFNEIGAFQTGIKFDPAVLRYTNINQSGLSEVDIGERESEQGQLKILWQADFSTPSVTLADSTVLFELCFDVLGAYGTSSTIAFNSLSDFPLEFSSEIGQSLAFSVSPGAICLTPENTRGDTVLSITVSSINSVSNQTACVDVFVNGFRNITGFAFDVDWNSETMSLTEVRNFNLPNLGLTQFVPSGNTSIMVLWNPTSAQSVKDGTSIFQLCFEAIDECNNSSSDVTILTDSIPIDFNGLCDEELDVDITNGEIFFVGIGCDIQIVPTMAEWSVIGLFLSMTICSLISLRQLARKSSTEIQ